MPYARTLYVVILSVIVLQGAPLQSNDMLEAFALSKDRAAVLAKLIPGTEDYFYYHVLHYQTVGRLEESGKLVEQWIAQHGRTGRATQMLYRQFLLAYDKNPNPTLEFLTRELGLQLSHELPATVRERRLPSQLDPQMLDELRLVQDAIQNHGNLSQVTERGLLQLDGGKLPMQQLRELLGRFPYPTHPKLVDWIHRELTDKQSRGFGSLAAHQLLTLAQLDDLQKRQPELLGNQAFVSAKLQRLRPDAGVDMAADRSQRLAYLTRLEAFTRQLPPAFRSLRTSTLFYLLDAQRRMQKYDADLFLEYIKLPRQVPYIRPALLERAQGQIAQLGDDHSRLALLPPVGNDEPLVRDFLERFLKEAPNTDAYKPYFEDGYLQRVFVETKILFGVGDPLTWFNQLTADQQRELRERVELDWSISNPSIWSFEGSDSIADRGSSGGPVRLEVDIKNIDRLSVRVFRINLAAYYQQFQGPVNTDIDLDGLVAAVQWEQSYNHSPWLRHREVIELKGVEGRGVWVVDLVGGGRRSRALIARGDLRVIEDRTSAGHQFTVLDEQLRPVAGATMRVAGQEFTSDSDGKLTVPRIDKAKDQRAVLVFGDFAKQVRFKHEAEAFALRGSFFLHREGLQAGRETTLLVRSSLLLGDRPTSIRLLTSPVVTVTATDMDGSVITQRFDDIQLFEDRETEITLRTPPRLRTMHIELSANVRRGSVDQTETLTASESFEFEAIRASNVLYQAQLAQTTNGYRLEVVGHTGEPAAALPVQLQFVHAAVAQPVYATLAADDQGHVQLGRLEGVRSLMVMGDKLKSHQWSLGTDSAQWPAVLQVAAGEKIVLPAVPWSSVAAGRSNPWAPLQSKPSDVPGTGRWQLIESRGSANGIDVSSKVKLINSTVEIDGLTPGQYELRDWSTDSICQIQVASGKQLPRHVVAQSRTLELVKRPVARIESIERKESSLVVKLANTSKFTRVHALLSRYVSPLPPSKLRMPDVHPWLANYRPPLSGYVSNLRLDDEYRYVLERQLAKRYPGNMLPQPTLLLHPWDIGESQAKEIEMQRGENMPKVAATSEAPGARQAPEFDAMKDKSVAVVPGDPLSVEYLKNSGRLLVNVIPTDAGTIEFDKDDLQDAQQLTLIVVDPLTVQVRGVPLQETPLTRDDLRLAKSLPIDKSFAQTRAVLPIDKNQPLEIGDVQSARAQVYSCIADLYQYYSAQLKDDKLAKFAFLPKWHQLDEATRLAKYNEFACHEMHLFLYFKDRPFFNKVVKPLLEQKKDPEFIDQWLLGRDLTPFNVLWRFAELNAAERALLAVRLPSQRAAIARSLHDWLVTHPVDPQSEQRRLMSALAGKALDSAVIAGAELSYGGAYGGMGGMMGGYPNPKSEMADGGGSMGGVVSEMKSDGPQEMLNRFSRKRGRVGQEGYFFNNEPGRFGLFRQIDTTKRWAESNYYRLTRAQVTAEIVPIRSFWLDLCESLPQPDQQGDGEGITASHGLKLSTDLLAPIANASEALLALAVIDLPLEPVKIESTAEEGKLVIRSPTPAVVVTEQIREVKPKVDGSPTILIGQRLSAEIQQPIPGQPLKALKEFVVGEVYISQVVLSNPSEQPVDVDVLLQIPAGSLPLGGIRSTDSQQVRLEPFSTRQIGYAFYFPQPGQFTHYGATASSQGTFLASVPATTITVLPEPSGPDEGSWQYLVQKGTADQLVAYLREKANLFHVDLEYLAPRMQEKDVFTKVTATLGELRRFQPTLWAYGLKHNDPQRIAEYLDHRSDVVQQCGPVLHCKLLSIEPVERELYEHIEFRPLQVPRQHPTGGKWQIPNEQLQQQWEALLNVLAYSPKPTDRQRLSLAYFLLLQQRIDEAIEQVEAIDRAALGMSLAYDYLTAYTNFYRGRYDDALRLAMAHESNPSLTWRERFSQVVRQVREHRSMIEGESIELPEGADDSTRLVSTRDVRRDQEQGIAATLQPAFDLRIEGHRAHLKWQNLEEVRVNYYVLDVELLFTRNPFVQNGSSRASLVEPNATKLIRLPAKQGETQIEIPEHLARQNVLVEVVSGGLRQSQVASGGDLALQLATGYGQLQASVSGSTKPVIGAYVKVYARTNDGQVKFWKDGYTDLRGRFEYASVSGAPLGQVKRFALLVLDPEHGALIRESEPPR